MRSHPSKITKGGAPSAAYLFAWPRASFLTFGFFEPRA
jgi:hypothetical protein